MLGEILLLVREPSTIVTVLQKSDVNIHYDNIGYPTSVSITLRHCKNMTNNQPTTISISGQTNRDLKASINLSKISVVMGKRVSVLPANLLQPFNNFRTIKEEVGS
jgi:hypothetical protein